MGKKETSNNNSKRRQKAEKRGTKVEGERFSVWMWYYTNQPTSTSLADVGILLSQNHAQVSMWFGFSFYKFRTFF